MKDYKTTLAGLVLGLPIAEDALSTAYQQGAFTGKSVSQTLIAVGIILLTLWAKDRTKPIENPAPPTETLNSNQ